MTSPVEVHVLHQVPIERLERLINESQKDGFTFLVRMKEECNRSRFS